MTPALHFRQTYRRNSDLPLLFALVANDLDIDIQTAIRDKEAVSRNERGRRPQCQRITRR